MRQFSIEDYLRQGSHESGGVYIEMIKERIRNGIMS